MTEIGQAFDGIGAEGAGSSARRGRGPGDFVKALLADLDEIEAYRPAR